MNRNEPLKGGHMRHARSFDKYSPAELKEISRKAGQASGAARRKKRELIEQKKLEDRAHQEELHTMTRLLKESTSLLYQARKENERAGNLPKTRRRRLHL